MAAIILLVYLVLWYTVTLAATKSLNVAELVQIGDADGVEWVLSWHPSKSNDTGQILIRPSKTAPFFDEYPAIMLAILRGKTEMCRLLTQAGGQVDASFRDKLGRNFVHLAVLAPMPEVVELASDDSILNAPDATASGNTPIHLAVERRDEKMIDLLVRRGADINALDARRLPAISRVSPDEEAFLSHMLKLGANPGLCPGLLYESIAKHKISAIKRLIDAGIDPKALHHGEPMWRALFTQKNPDVDATADVMSLLLARGMDVNSLDTQGNHALFYACRSGCSKTVAVILDAKANIKWRDKRGASPLYIAAEHGHADIVEALYKALADKNTKLKPECGGTTALHAAAANGHTAVVRFLAKHGAKLLIRSKSHKMAIHLAAANGREDVIDVLLKEGNNINEIVIGANKTVLDVAIDAGQEDLVAKLKARGAKTFKQLEAEDAERRKKLWE